MIITVWSKHRELCQHNGDHFLIVQLTSCNQAVGCIVGVFITMEAQTGEENCGEFSRTTNAFGTDLLADEHKDTSYGCYCRDENVI